MIQPIQKLEIDPRAVFACPTSILLGMFVCSTNLVLKLSTDMCSYMWRFVSTAAPLYDTCIYSIYMCRSHAPFCQMIAYELHMQCIGDSDWLSILAEPRSLHDKVHRESPQV